MIPSRNRRRAFTLFAQTIKEEALERALTLLTDYLYMHRTLAQREYQKNGKGEENVHITLSMVKEQN